MIKLWFRHPFRMWSLASGYCPLCNSSPPDPKCFVCEGSYRYGNKLHASTKQTWLVRFQAWILYNKKL